MPDILADLVVKLGLEKASYTKALTDAKTEANSAGAQLSSAFLTIGASLGTVAAVGAAAYKTIIAPTLEYNNAVREMRDLTGLSAEEISRLTQVGADWGIETETLKMSMEQLAKKGFTPSIDNLATLADEYVSATNKTEFLQDATKKYGRGIMELVPLLAKGGKELRNQTDAVLDAQVATDESIAANRRFEESVDTLTDAWEGFILTVGNKVIPMLADYLTPTVEEVIDGQKVLTRMIDGQERKFIRQGQVLVDVTTQYQQVGAAARRFAKEDLIAVETEVTNVTEDLEDMSKTAEETAQRYLDLSFTLGGLTADAEDFNEKQKAVKSELEKTNARIDELEGKSYLTGKQKEELEELKTKQKELQEEYRKNAEEFDKATAQIIYDISAQLLAMDGLTAEEAELLIKTAEGLGLVDSASAQAASEINAVFAKVQSGGMTAEMAIKKVKQILDALKSKTITVTVNTRYTEGTKFYEKNKDQVGGEVKKGSVHWVGEIGAEPFIPAQDGRILSVSQAQEALAKATLGVDSGGGGGGGLYINNLTYLISGDLDVQKVYYNLQDAMLSASRGDKTAKFLRS